MSEELEGTTCGAWPRGQKNPCDGSLIWLGDDDDGNSHYKCDTCGQEVEHWDLVNAKEA